MTCPGCGAPMARQEVLGYLGRTVAIDHCAPCQVFWFDGRVVLQLTPANTLALFKVVGDAAQQSRRPLPPVLKCPTCRSHLRLTHDRQRNVAFSYFRCPHDHGRLTSFFDFLRQKNLIRPLSPEQISELRQNVQTINCANCGAPVDLGRQSSCDHCGTPLSIVDLKQAGAVIEQLRSAARPDGAVDPDLPVRLAAARREVDRAFADMANDSWQASGAKPLDLLDAGLSFIGRWLNL